IVEASGFIWATSGQRVATPPTAAAAPVATKRKSRRVGWSAEDAVVTIPGPFSSAAGSRLLAAPWIANGPERLPAPVTPRGGRNDRLLRPNGRNIQSRIVLLAPLPEERKPARRMPACNARNPRSVAIYSGISWAI